uniref:cysteine dioxygenase n=2 Tax=Oryza sativa subsp. japonica TaxID=39947 RepID=Q6YSD8_ORYSJ|nr:HGWP repeat containing protein-like protein [Oryza sativa Japonica Group]BAD32010.1 HGWP repeat containing protein-like protein [Oryza sativa Japonica Group]
MVVLVHHQAYWSNLPNEDAMVLQDGSTNTKHAKTDLIGCIGDGCSHADAFLPSCVVLMDTNAARDCDLRLLRSVSESVEEINLGEFFPFNLRLRQINLSWYFLLFACNAAALLLPTGVSVCTAGLLCRRCWASTTSPPACLRRRRVVPPPTRLAYYAAAVGRLRLHRRPASVAAEWCLRLHGWPIMPPLLGVYDFTAGLPPSPPSGASAYTAGLLCRRCWASTTSPPACLRRRRVVPPPTRLAYYAAAVGRLRLHRRPASVAAEWCLRLYGWPIMPPLLGVYDFTAGLPPSPPSGASAYTAGLLCRRCWMSTSSPLAHLRCRRLVFPLTRLTYYAAISGHLRFHRRPPSSPPTGVFIVIDGRLCSHIGHFCHHQGEYYKAKSSFILFFI